ncbi:type II toxin-antitoxin system VapC family toxin [Modestobacter sp. VKM Ac-2985]|uniref:type II toxin-antitoxin system VapC family toxin n=1 Tax=Modestobacter sp. VKM Ac-2985 TaxID=3004139 RepID=UPI0022ABB018|nr:type II toxin-antitoxin system VapC family toxin [Modestobacter sp. VKM Ac-2985]MCZ2839946.1 type II toxin-antitoxin system VapC family toxin [Modestobacter sp. VKM Ac-2985]
MIVLDASAAVAALLRDGSARESAAREQLHAPHLIDAEVAQTLRRLVSAGRLPAHAGKHLLLEWSALALVRHPAHPLLPHIWALRENVTAYDATYVALAEALGCALLTADTRLARAPGTTCPVTVVAS